MKYILIILTLSFFLLYSCEEDTTGTEINPDKSKSLVDSARKALEDVLYSLINEGAEGPQDVNFEVPFDLYSQAYAADPDNKDAVFGFALTNMMMVNQESEVNDVFDEWNDLLGEDDGLGKTALIKKPFLPTTQESFSVPQKQILHTLFKLPTAALKDPPRFDDLQDLIATHVLPKLEFASEAFDIVDDDPDFVFMVSPRMQGDAFADSVELDLTEVYAMQVVINMLNTMANMVVAYNIDFWGYDSTEALAVFSKGGSFLKLRRGSGPMQKVKSSFYKAMDKMSEGLTYLYNESDDQSDDLIPKDDLTLQDIEEVNNTFAEIKDNIDTPQQITDDWDNDPFTPEETITMNFGQIFDNPIEDLKSVIPDYTITVSGEDIFGDRWRSSYHDVNTQVTVAQDGYQFYYRYFDWDIDGYEYDSGPSSSLPAGNPIELAFNNLKASLLADDTILGIYMWVNWGANLVSGTNNVAVSIYYEYNKANEYGLVYLPSGFAWEAQTFDQWIFPNPTFNGILPGMTDSEFKRIFGITENDWQM